VSIGYQIYLATIREVIVPLPKGTCRPEPQDTELPAENCCLAPDIPSGSLAIYKKRDR